MKVVWSEPAEAHLDAIIEYISRDNVQAALELDDKLHDAADSLLKFPNRGRRGRVVGTREFVACSPYLLIYVVDSDSITIVGVIHASQQYPPEWLPI